MTRKDHTEQPEFDLLVLLWAWWDGRKRLILSALLGAVLAAGVAFALPREYTATVKLVARHDRTAVSPELSGLTSLVGLSVNPLRRDEDLDAGLYPEIIASVPFLSGMSRVQTGDAPLSVYLPGLRGRTVEFGPDGPENHEQQKLLDAMRSHFRVGTDKKSGLITVSASLREPRAAAVAADSLVARLERYIIAHRIGKARDDLAFLSARFEESRREYHAAQQAYARFADANRHTAKESAAVERDRLYQEQLLAYNVYAQLAGQLETARLQVQEQTPVLSVLEPACVPVRHSWPRRSIFVLVGLLLGAAVPAGVIAGKTYWKSTNN
ncbi:hypothetical protein LJB87_01660 [Alistipes sp. OttesenSCG-928-L06]|nr:hypothetical protein [Alistipes sp. OttesenSCG-928-L06]